MADTTTQDTQQAPEQENETEVEQTFTEATETDQEAAQDDQGKGSKSAVLADLAKERRERQAAQTLAQETTTKLEQVLTALGINTESKVDPDQLAQDLSSQRAENAVLRAGNGIADVDALLDSRNFTDSLRDIDPSDRDAVKAHITEYVTANPRFAVATQAHGVRDAAAGADTARLTGSPAQQFAKWSAENFD